ncbi:hypothetical protein VOM14_05835 [Paraburkholderia sp. MPAMCS5]|uniref:hypothetical protein n=1 Tax=Paraburkholderia sp. MPAMCS5 TaxID=3112563 RepID=UPI002E1742A8|nr:hypothetical protein [Paraburkholderia sp. MPAMCS5]
MDTSTKSGSSGLYLANANSGKPYLGDPQVIGGLTRQLVGASATRVREVASGTLGRAAAIAADKAAVLDLADILAGKNANYETAGDWNPHGLASFVRRILAAHLHKPAADDDVDAIRQAVAILLRDVYKHMGQFAPTADTADIVYTLEAVAGDFTEFFLGLPRDDDVGEALLEPMTREREPVTAKPPLTSVDVVSELIRAAFAKAIARRGDYFAGNAPEAAAQDVADMRALGELLEGKGDVADEYTVQLWNSVEQMGEYLKEAYGLQSADHAAFTVLLAYLGEVYKVIDGAEKRGLDDFRWMIDGVIEMATFAVLGLPWETDDEAVSDEKYPREPPAYPFDPEEGDEQ